MSDHKILVLQTISIVSAAVFLSMTFILFTVAVTIPSSLNGIVGLLLFVVWLALLFTSTITYIWLDRRRTTKQRIANLKAAVRRGREAERELFRLVDDD